MASSYQTALTIAEIMQGIEQKQYLLPSIQREFVWDQKQIETLFDSLMREYPINSFLFWEVPEAKMQEFRFYEFLRNYHQRDHRHNPLANTGNLHGVTAILDGQQRMTSIYIGLKGTYAAKLPYLWWNNKNAYPEKQLYINLFPGEDLPQDFEYNFQFLTKEKATSKETRAHWYRVGDILDMKQDSDVLDYLMANVVYNSSPEEGKYASNVLQRLYSVIHKDGTVSPYVIKTDDLDKVLNIFIRVNSGGTPLSYSDLLLSIATAQWDDLDAREEINGLVDELNRIGDFNINKDLVLKASLVLCDIPNIRFKVDNFNQRNMLLIKEKWEEIKKSLRLGVELLASFGFNRDYISGYNSLIPIAYYLMQIGNPGNFVDSLHRKNDRNAIHLWYISTALLHTFSTSPDQLLTQLREIIRRDHDNGFPVESIRAEYANTFRDMSFTEDSIKNLLNSKNIGSETYMVLSLVYPWADNHVKYHIDHVHPKSRFNKREYEKMRLSEEQREYYASHVNSLANLQLLTSTPNEEKKNTPFIEWIDEYYPESEERLHYTQLHRIPEVDYRFSNFREFFEKREAMIFEKLKQVLL